MASNIDSSTFDGGICARVDGRRIIEELDKPTSWHWVGDLRSDMGSGYWRLVGAPHGEIEEKVIRAFESYGRSGITFFTSSR